MRAFRHVFVAWLAALAGAGHAVPVGDAQALRDALLDGRAAETVTAAKAARGCGPAGCSIDVDGVSILRERGVLRDASGRRIALQQHGQAGAAGLPEIDWELLDAYAVSDAGRHWGSCLEFAHAGIGKSGPYQRWGSVVLVPWPTAAGPGRVAHRFVGYWASCDALAGGARRGELVLPTVEPVAVGTTALRIVLHRCSARGCTAEADGRSVAADQGSPTGALVIGER